MRQIVDAVRWPDEAAQAMTDNGYLKTGTIDGMRKWRYFGILSCKKDMIVVVWFQCVFRQVVERRGIFNGTKCAYA